MILNIYPMKPTTITFSAKNSNVWSFSTVYTFNDINIYICTLNKLFTIRVYLYVCVCVLYVVTFREVIGLSRVGARFQSAGRRERCVS